MQPIPVSSFQDWQRRREKWTKSTTAGKFCLRQKSPKQLTYRTLSKPERIWNKDMENAQETSYPKICDLLLPPFHGRYRLFGSPATPVPDDAQMRAHIVTVTNSRTRGPGPVRMGKLTEEASSHVAVSDE